MGKQNKKLLANIKSYEQQKEKNKNKVRQKPVKAK